MKAKPKLKMKTPTARRRECAEKLLVAAGHSSPELIRMVERALAREYHAGLMEGIRRAEFSPGPVLVP